MSAKNRSLQPCMQIACIYLCLSVDLCEKPKREISTSVFWDEFYEEMRKKTLRVEWIVNPQDIYGQIFYQYLCFSCRNLKNIFAYFYLDWRVFKSLDLRKASA